MTSMTPIDQVLAEWKNVKSWVTEKVDERMKPTDMEVKRIANLMTGLQKIADDWSRERVARVQRDGRLVVREGPFQGLDLLELQLAERLLGARRIGSKYLGQIPQARLGLVKAFTDDSVFAWEENAIKRRLASWGRVGEPSGFNRFKDAALSWRSQMFQVIRKALDSTTASSGDELVPTMEAAELWMDVNLDTKVLPLFIQSPMPTNPFDIPSQFGDVNWYPTAENEQGTTTTVSTGKMTLTAYELKAGVPFSDTLEEDAIIALVPELRRNLAMNGAEVIDDVMLNGDTTTTNGINSDGATISKTTAGKAQWLLGFDGLIHLPIIDNTAQRTAHSSTITAGLFNKNLRLLGKYAAPARRGDVVHLSDVNTLITAMTIAQVETEEKFGPRATISSGELASVYGVPYILSEQFKLADTDGKVTNSGGNTVGRVLTVNTTQWRVGFRREMTFEADREPGKSQTTLYVSFRIAFGERTGTRSSASHTAIQYDISGVT